MHSWTLPVWRLHAQSKTVCFFFVVDFTCHPSDQACSSMHLPQWLVILPDLNKQWCSRLWTDGQIIQLCLGKVMDLVLNCCGVGRDPPSRPLQTVPIHSLKMKLHNAFMWPAVAIISVRSHILFPHTDHFQRPFASDCTIVTHLRMAIHALLGFFLLHSCMLYSLSR